MVSGRAVTGGVPAHSLSAGATLKAGRYVGRVACVCSGNHTAKNMCKKLF